MVVLQFKLETAIHFCASATVYKPSITGELDMLDVQFDVSSKKIITALMPCLFILSTPAFAGGHVERCILNALGKNDTPSCEKIYGQIDFSRRIAPSMRVSKIDFNQKGCATISTAVSNTSYCGFTMHATHDALYEFLMNNLTVSFGKNMYGGISCAAPSSLNTSSDITKDGGDTYHVVCSKNYSELPLYAVENIGKKNHLFNNASFLGATDVAELFKYRNNLFRGYLEERMGNEFIIAQVCSSQHSCSGTTPQPAFLSLSPVVLNADGEPKKDDGMDVYYSGFLPLSYIEKSIRNTNGEDFVYLKRGVSQEQKIGYISTQNKLSSWLSDPSVHLMKTRYSHYYHSYFNINSQAFFKFLSRSGKWVYVTPGVSLKHISELYIKAPKTGKSTITVLKSMPDIKFNGHAGLHGLKKWMLRARIGHNTVCGVVTATTDSTITVLNKKMVNVTYPSGLLFAMQESGKCSFKKAKKFKLKQSVIFYNH